MSVAGVQTYDFRIGRVFQRAFATIGENVAPLALLSLIYLIPYTLFALLKLTVLKEAAAAADAGVLSTLRGVPGESVVDTVANTFATGAITYLVLSRWAGKSVTAGEALGAGGRVFWPVLGINILYGLGVGLGLVLLIVPGVFAAILWTTALPARVDHGRGVMAAFERSAKLTQGLRGSVLGCLAIMMAILVVAIIVSGVLGYVMGLAPGVGETLSTAVVEPFLTTALGVLAPIMIASLYFELKHAKEGGGATALAEVFG